MTVVDPVLSLGKWSSNAALIADIARLGLLTEDGLTLDPTYGKGNWWTVWRPTVLITNDQHVTSPKIMYHQDFRSLSFIDNTFDQIAFDPPYVSKGGRKTSGIKPMDRAYGIEDAPRTPALVQELINDGLDEMYRLVKPNGIVLVKCKSYISSGKFFDGEFQTQEWAHHRGFTTVDRFIFESTPMPQRGQQRHARNNFSTMFAFRK